MRNAECGVRKGGIFERQPRANSPPVKRLQASHQGNGWTEFAPGAVRPVERLSARLCSPEGGLVGGWVGTVGLLSRCFEVFFQLLTEVFGFVHGGVKRL